MTDTALKRRSAAGVPAIPLGPGVTPDNTKPQAWRQAAGWGYSGIPAGTPIPPPLATEPSGGFAKGSVTGRKAKGSTGGRVGTARIGYR